MTSVTTGPRQAAAVRDDPADVDHHVCRSDGPVDARRRAAERGEGAEQDHIYPGSCRCHPGVPCLQVDSAGWQARSDKRRLYLTLCCALRRREMLEVPPRPLLYWRCGGDQRRSRRQTLLELVIGLLKFLRVDRDAGCGAGGGGRIRWRADPLPVGGGSAPQPYAMC
jgi:hypothetical protein